MAEIETANDGYDLECLVVFDNLHQVQFRYFAFGLEPSKYDSLDFFEVRTQRQCRQVTIERLARGVSGW